MVFFQALSREGRSFAVVFATGMTCLILLSGLTDAACAQGGRLEARYEATLAGIQVGKGVWTVDIGQDQFSTSASGGSAGLLKAFAGGQGTSVSQGRVVNGQLVSGSYAVTVASDGNKKAQTIRMELSGGNVRESSVEPEPPPTPDRIPVTAAHRRGATDPMTGSLLRVPGTSDPVGPEACRSGSSIFDGRMRYDLQLEFKRIETVVSQKGYQGPALVCAIYFTPVAGYVPDRVAIKYLAAQRDMEVWFVPIAGTRVLAPYKLLIPTPVGMAALEATQFLTAPTARTTAKTQ